MRTIFAAGLAVAASLTMIACGRTGESQAHVERVRAWRAEHEASYRRNFVTIAGLHFLRDGTYTAGGARTNDLVLSASLPPTIGRFVVAGTRVRFEPAAGVSVQHNGSALAGPVDLRDSADAAPDELSVGDVRFVVHRSGERVGIRVWDPGGPVAQGFLGFRWFDIDPAYQVTGRFIRDAQPRRVQVMNTFGDVDTFTTEGVVEFSLHGQTLRLRPFTTRPNRFFFVFRDATSGVDTYEAARFLYADLHDDGTAVLDFNMAYNPPCAFNPYTTCPIPLRENVLPSAVRAGERDYPVKVELTAASD